MGKHDPPSAQLLDLLHYVEDLSGFIHSRPKTTSDAARILWFHIRRLRGLEVEWPLAQPGGIPGVVPLSIEVAGVTSIKALGNPQLTGDVILAPGTGITLSQAGQTITITAAGGPSQTAHGCRVFNNAAETITTGTVTQLTFNSERDDTDGYHDTAANTSRITIPAGLAGVYQISGAVEFAAGATGVRVVRIRLNGATVIANMLENTATGGNTTVMTISTAYRLAVADFVELEVFHTQGANLNVNSTANYSPEFMAYMVGT